MSELPTIALGDDYPERRESVHKICERYPGAYWRKLEAEQAAGPVKYRIATIIYQKTD